MILGQEAVVAKYGLGRIVEIGPEFCGKPKYVAIKTYADDIRREYAPGNVTLVPVWGL